MRKKDPKTQLLLIVFVMAALPLSIFALLAGTNLISRGFSSFVGTEANITVNLTDSYPFTPPWSHLSQGGEERDGMIGDVVKETKALSPTYIRIDHVFDFYDVVGRNTDGTLNYNWTKLDSEITAIRSTGALPFISISYMPSAISSGSEIDTPRDWNEWRQVVRALIEHISGTNGLNINNVYYEVWNEPDLFGGFTVSGQKNYLPMYRFAALGAQDARNTRPFKFGGPAITAFYPAWATSLLTMTSQENLRMDFFSWHRYSKDLTVFETDITKAKESLISFPQYADLELVISESGFDSNNNPANDGNLSAIHTLALYATTFDKIEKLFHFEIKDGPGPSQYWGRWGLLTHEKYGTPVAKPRYQALSFLNQMRGEFFPIYGLGSWVKGFATKDGETIRLLLVNYDLNGLHTENVPVSFVNMPYNAFTYTRKNFLGNVETNDVTIASTNWTFVETMKPNTAAIIEISPK